MQIKYVDTKNKLADLLTKGNVTCVKWNHLLHLFNIMNSRCFFSSHFLSIKSRTPCPLMDICHLISAEYKGRTSPTQSTASSSSPVFPSYQTTTCTPPTGLLLGRFAVQSPLTGYEPNASVEVSSTEVTPTLFPSRNGSIGSPYNSGDDTATTPAVSEVGKRSDWGMLASPLFSQERQGRTHSEFISL